MIETDRYLRAAAGMSGIERVNKTHGNWKMKDSHDGLTLGSTHMSECQTVQFK